MIRGEINFLDGTVESTEGDLLSVQTALGVFTAQVAGERRGLATGRACTLSIRPESWKLSTHPTTENCFAGHLRERVYLGEMAQYLFAAGSHEIRVYELNRGLWTLSGERELFASVEPEDVMVLPR